jgi:DNA-binding HxlR family transcriptional regulator
VTLDESAGYRLTELGDELLRLFLPLHAWSEKWAGLVK